MFLLQYRQEDGLLDFENILLCPIETNMQTNKDILNKLSQHAKKLRKTFSVHRIGLFGSYVHGSADQDSDVDILVELDDPSFDHYMDLKFYLENLFGTSVDLVLADTIKPRLQPIITREVVYAKGL